MDDTQFKQKMVLMVERNKFVLAVIMLLVTLGWSAFAVYATERAITLLKVTDILSASGAGVMTGIFGTLTTLVFQHYFRRAKPE
jgi:fluoride ion exporter CrcB/FEX